MGYFGNPYQPQPIGYNPYGGYAPASPQNAAGGPQPFAGQITRVNGKNGAEAFRLAPNSSILLMDENDPIVWLKQTDGAGYATVTPYTVAPYQAAAPVDVNSLENRVKRLEEMLNAKSDDADAAGKQQTAK
nr:MAG TPA: zipper dimerization domain transcription factor-like protein [Caudoviricetes sp.]